MSVSNHGLVDPSNPATTPYPSTPSKSRGGSNASQGPSALCRDQSPSFRMLPSMPSRGINRSNAPLPTPATPQQRKDNALLCLHGIKTRMPENLSLDSICTHLIASSDIRFLRCSTVHSDTQSPMLLSIVIAHELVPLILKNNPRISGNRFIAQLWAKVSEVIEIITAYTSVNGFTLDKSEFSTYQHRISCKTFWYL